MDIDENGIPCETKFTSDVIAGVWSGGWLPAAPATLAGEPIDMPVEEGDGLDVVGVAHDDPPRSTKGPADERSSAGPFRSIQR